MRRITMFAMLLLAAFAGAQNFTSLKHQGFDGTWVKFGAMQAGFMEVTLRVDQDPFHFEYKGKVNVGTATRELPSMLDDEIEDDVVFVVSYYEPLLKDGKGVGQVAAFASIHLIADEQVGKFKDGQFTLLPATAEVSGASAAMAAAQQKRAAYVASMDPDELDAEEEAPINAAMADPWNKEVKEQENSGEAIKQEKRTKDSLAMVEKAAKRKADSLAAMDALRKKQEAEKLALAAAAAAEKNKVQKSVKKKKLKKLEEEAMETEEARQELAEEVEDEYPELAEEEEEDYVPPPTKVKKKKKKKITAEEQEESAASASRMDDPKFRKNLTIGLTIGGAAAAGFGIWQHQEMNKNLKAMNDLNTNTNTLMVSYNTAATPELKAAYLYGAQLSAEQATAKEDLKNGNQSNRNIGLMAAVILLGGAVVVYRW